MTDAPRAARGRPKLASVALLEEAAFELFLENGYAGTTIEQITTRAGVSRNTFFNYFHGKSDVFWVGLDASIERLSRETTPLREALLAAAEQLGPSAVPWVLTHFDLIGSPHEVLASAIGRASRLAQIIESSSLSRSLSFACVGAIIAAMQSWAEAGPQRGTLAAHLERAIESILPS